MQSLAGVGSLCVADVLRAVMHFCTCVYIYNNNNVVWLDEHTCNDDEEQQEDSHLCVAKSKATS